MANIKRTSPYETEVRRKIYKVNPVGDGRVVIVGKIYRVDPRGRKIENI